MVRVDMEFPVLRVFNLISHERAYYMNILMTTISQRFLFEDFLRFTNSCPKSDKRSEHFQKFPKIANISEGNRRFLRKKRRCFDQHI